MQMKATRLGADAMRKVVDKVNGGILFTAGPVVEFVKKVSFDAPWLFLIATTGTFMLCPLIAYPWVKRWLLKDPREAREAERVRMCLEKGIDPFPTIQHKDFVFGNMMPAFQRDADEAPRAASWEHSAMIRYREAKAKLIAETGGDVEKDVETLKKLREELRRASNQERTSYAVEPEGLTFRPREGVNVLRS